MDRLSAIETFVRIAEGASFTAVARELGLSQPAVSKQIATLERHLGVTLLTRTTRALSLTDEGRRYYEHCRSALAELAIAEDDLGGDEGPLRGRLRIGVGTGFGRHKLMPILASLQKRHPALEIDLRLSDVFVDLVQEGIDVAIRGGPAGEGDIIVRPLARITAGLYASRDYLEARGRPRTLADLAAHDCVLYAHAVHGAHWVLQTASQEGPVTERVAVRGRFRTSGLESVRDAVAAGIGIGLVPNWLMAPPVALPGTERVLGEWSSPPVTVSAVYPASRRGSRKVRRFIEHLAASFAADPALQGLLLPTEPPR